MTTLAEKRHLDRVSALGCVVCRNLNLGESPAEIHHLRDHTGQGLKEDHYHTIPLCFPHHRGGQYGIAYHSGAAKWEEKYGTQVELLEQTWRELGIEELPASDTTLEK